MLNKFCFHLYDQNSLFIGENCNAFFLDLHHHHTTLSPDIRVHRAGSQLKIIAIVGYKQRLLSLDMIPKIVQHVEREWMRQWESVRVWECESVRVREYESERVTFEHRHENKSCSACRERVFQFFTVFNNIQTLEFMVPSFCLTFRHL